MKSNSVKCHCNLRDNHILTCMEANFHIAAFLRMGGQLDNFIATMKINTTACIETANI